MGPIRPRWELALLGAVALSGCGAECPEDAEICDGVFQYGQLGLTANPVAVDGLYAPLLVGCTREVYDGSDLLSWSEYDDRGRQVLSSRPPDSVGTQITDTFEWAGPCLTEATQVFDQLVDSPVEVRTTHTCDDLGWPVYTATVYGQTESTPATMANQYRGRRLTNVTTWRGDDLSGFTRLDWKDGRPIRWTALDADKAESWNRQWSWSEDVPEATTYTNPEQQETTVWTYGDDGRLAKRVVTTTYETETLWRYRDDATRPHLETEPGVALRLEYTCR